MILYQTYGLLYNELYNSRIVNCKIHAHVSSCIVHLRQIPKSSQTSTIVVPKQLGDMFVMAPGPLDSRIPTRIITRLGFGDSELNLHFPLLQGGGHIQVILFPTISGVNQFDSKPRPRSTCLKKMQLLNLTTFKQVY